MASMANVLIAPAPLEGLEVEFRHALLKAGFELVYPQLGHQMVEPELARFGTSSESRYDTLGRKLREDFANGTFATIEYSAWTTREFDANDTVDQSAYKAATRKENRLHTGALLGLGLISWFAFMAGAELYYARRSPRPCHQRQWWE